MRLLVIGCVVAGCVVAALALAGCASRDPYPSPAVGPITQLHHAMSSCSSTRPSKQCQPSPAAMAAARALVARVVLPHGAVVVPIPDAGPLAHSGIVPSGDRVADYPEMWQVPGSMAAVTAFLEAHPPAGMRTTITGGGGSSTLTGYSIAPLPAGMCAAQLVIIVAPSGSNADMRVDGDAMDHCT